MEAQGLDLLDCQLLNGTADLHPRGAPGCPSNVMAFPRNEFWRVDDRASGTPLEMMCFASVSELNRNRNWSGASS